MIYLHIPFCKSFCTYCDFYSEICRGEGSAKAQNLFYAHLCTEIDARRDDITLCHDPRTLYVGGGTPSVLPAEMLGKAVSRIGLKEWEEFTVEVNPEDIVEKGPDYVRELLAMGVNRISMGVQSLDDGILRWMNRRHDSDSALKAFRILRDCGVGNISLDLIFGLSILSDESWEDTVRLVIELHPEHISCYQLSIEEGSALGRMVHEGRYAEASEDQCRRQYDHLCGMLGKAGYVHYEISNFALPGFEAVHNSAYWDRKPYVGLGPGAHSFDGVRRSWNSQDLSGWTPSYETLSSEDARVETIMLGLRTSQGVSASLLPPKKLQKMLREGSLEKVSESGTRVRIPEDRFFVSDSIISELV